MLYLSQILCQVLRNVLDVIVISVDRKIIVDVFGHSAEVIVNYLSSHVMLVYNEERQRQIIGEYNRVTQNWPEEEKQLYNLDTTLPDDKCKWPALSDWE